MKRYCKEFCPNIQVALEVLSKPWSGVILMALDEGPLRFNELQEHLGAIGDRMLSLRLKELEAQGLLTREVIAGTPVRVQYELTDKARGFRKVAKALGQWGAALAESRSHH